MHLSAQVNSNYMICLATHASLGLIVKADSDKSIDTNSYSTRNLKEEGMYRTAVR